MLKPQPAVDREAKILIVDDEVGNLKVLTRLLAQTGYQNISTADNGNRAVELYQSLQPDLVVLDLKMPRMSGFDVLDSLSKVEEDYLPVLVLTGQKDDKTRLKALHAGAKDFISKPFDVAEIVARINNIVEVRLLHVASRNENRGLEQRVEAATREVRQSRMDVIHRLSRAAEYRDNETGMHVIRMSKYSEALARALGMTHRECKLIYHASPMHDVGKIGIPDSILLKPGKLTKEEWKIMKTHSEIGARILSGSDSELMQKAEVIARNHHENWQGTGYPNRIKGEDIPLEARIVTLCDVFDALTSERPYKKAWLVTRAVRELKNKSGVLFDPKLVQVFESILPKIIDISQKFSDKGGESVWLESVSQLLEAEAS